MSASAADWCVGPTPGVPQKAVLDVLSKRFGVSGTVRDLGSQQDRNFRVQPESGESYVLKVSNPATGPDALRAQCQAVEHLTTTAPGLRLPRARRGTDGEYLQPLRTESGELHCRLFDYVDGEPIMDSRYLAPHVIARLGELSGRITAGLAGFTPVGIVPSTMWDLRNALEVVESLAPHMSEAKDAQRVLRAALGAHRVVAAVADRLPVQMIHGDVTDNNVVFDRQRDGRPLPAGVIDFGDLSYGWTVAELAVTCTSILHHHGASPASVLPAVRAFHTVRPLGPDETAVLWPLIVLRASVLVASGRYDVQHDPGNAYAAAALEREWAMFEMATSQPVEVMTAQLCHELEQSATEAGRLARAHDQHSVLWASDGHAPGYEEQSVRLAVVDLSVHNDALHSGRWLSEGIESELVAHTLAEHPSARAVRTAHGEHRLTRARTDVTTSTATLALGVELHPRSSAVVHAPWAGTVVPGAGRALTLTRDDGPALFLDGVDATVERGPVVAGQPLGTVPGAGNGDGLWIQLSQLESAVVPPRFVSADLAAGWLAVCPDPTRLLVADPAPDCGVSAGAVPGESAAELLLRRDRAFARVQEHYYLEPPRIERGWRHHLVDTEARTYLDMLNNVTVLGHGHPVLSDAVHRQWQRLNTNSRFHYGSVVELSERLAELLPPELDTVFLVNSGSEAVDLALRLAWAATERQDVVAVGEAYHGWTFASDAVSTSIADNPNALVSRPSWVHTVPAPNSYRGRHRGTQAHRYGPEAAEAIAELARSGRAPAAFVAEAYYGNAGGMALPDGYLEQVYAATRAAGGLCIADEVQVGYGRLGTWFWGFEQQGVVPDIVTIAKSMGNGHPLGAVITRRGIADAYRSQGYFFASAGGSPVSSTVGLTVLDVLRDEGLRENASTVGAYLKAGLEALAERHPLIGAVHGNGLYLGVEFVRDRVTLEPATEETAAICERLRELGAIVQPTSDRQCVLKIKPPMCLTDRSADVFLSALDDVLSHGW
ncbi:aminotransferase [Streptomyces sp. NBC_00690]|uniref:aminotransferase n=1 Tax=Streptomyces sp. NBC_00690 TaxID=2975808 RepID=UPI002E2AC76A|nr:aminotransferase [Streptomyces sp. NBC_00690]